MSKKLRELQAKKAAAAAAKAENLKTAAGLLDKASAENRDLTEAEAAQFDTAKLAAAAKDSDIERLQAQIDVEQELIAAQAAAGSFAVINGDGSMLSVEENIEKDAKRGWKHFGEFANAVARRQIHGQLDARLGFNAAAPTTFGNEATGADGGFAIPPGFSTEIWRQSLGEESLIPRTLNVPLTGNSMTFPKDETTPWGSAGVQVYWQAEGTAGTQSKMNLGADTEVLHNMIALVPVTNQLLEDGFAVGSYLDQVAPERITWKANEAILFGDGVGKPLGALNGTSAVIVAKESGQAANTVDPKNLSKMVSRLLTGQMRNAFWLANPDVLPALEAMTVGNYPIYLPGNNASGSAYGTLKGMPLMLSEHAKALSAQGDLNLLSLAGYRTITKAGGIETATSMHLYFDAAATAFRFIFRLNGKPLLSTAVTPPNSSNTRSHFIQLGAR